MPTPSRRISLSLPGLALALASVVHAAGAERALPPSLGHLEFLGETVVPSPGPGGGPPVGGLSALVWDARSDAFLALSDDRAERGPARFYTIGLQLEDGRLSNGAVTVRSSTELRLEDGAPFGRGRVDPEGLAILPSGELLLSSEGIVGEGIDPFIRVVSREGRVVDSIELPPRYRVRSDGQAGMRDNFGFEGLTVSPTGRLAFAGVETSLIQDGPAADHETPAPARLVAIDLERRRVSAEYVYPVEPLWERDEGQHVNISGLVEILALDDRRLLALERSFVMGRGNRVLLFEVDLEGADNVLDVLSLADRPAVRPVAKRLLLDVGKTGVRPDNLEGLALGPPLADGRPVLWIVADDNFNVGVQRSQLLAYALGPESRSIPEIQGRSHRSRWVGDWVRGVEGVVTGVRPARGGGSLVGFWLQAAPDRDAVTSDGVYVESSAPVSRGDVVRVDGAVRERDSPGELSVTYLAAGSVETLSTTADLPEPVLLRDLPRSIDDDGFELFEPWDDLADRLESLEGMRVRLPVSRVIGPTSGFGELAVVLEEEFEEGRATSRGGLLASSETVDPHRWLLGSANSWRPPTVDVGARFTEPVDGILDYGFGYYRLEVDSWPPHLPAPSPQGSAIPLRGAGDLRVATYNVWNLDPGDPGERFEALADDIIGLLGSPDILALQEVQDDDGPVDDGVVTAGRTLDRLIGTIEAAGGPRYGVRQIDPEDGADGGQPGGNIRVVLLFRPDRLHAVDRGGTPHPESGASWIRIDGKSVLSPSPARLAPRAPAFAGDEAREWSGSRKCLAQEFERTGRTLFVVNCHLASKRGDDRVFGSHQPPQRRSEARRTAQAEEVARFASTLLSADPEAALVVLGDLNENEFREPIRRIEAAGLVNLVTSVPSADRYTFNYRGLSQVLDHILVSPALSEGAEAWIVHRNADIAHSGRSSDHDPILARLAWSTE